MCVVLCVSLRDMSGATWGGSSSEEEEEEEEGVSSGTGLNDTRDDLEQTFTGTLGMYIHSGFDWMAELQGGST